MAEGSGRVALIQEFSHRLTGSASDYDPLLELIGNARFVLIGEASHGTDEFYRVRSEITQRLIAERGFQAVAVEADWPDASEADRFVRGRDSARSAPEALAVFTRFPVWMWRNRVIAEFLTWLRDYNCSKPFGERTGFYGVDLYSLRRSREHVIRYLERVDPEAARRARQRYACFDHFGEDEQEYGYSAGLGMSQSCEQEVLQQLVELQRRAREYAARDGQVAEDECFSAEQNARLVRNAEEYYRAMFRGRVNTWNLRDQHMFETIKALAEHLERRYGRSRIVVWEHNSHLGDARATDRARFYEWNVGQLVRQKWGDAVRLIGFTTYTGTVTAASDWGGDHETKRVRPGLPGSYEALFHSTGINRFLLRLNESKELSGALGTERLERAIGVIYRPETERASHYFHARLSRQFDAVIHLDETSALQPLPAPEHEHPEDVPETFPSGV